MKVSIKNRISSSEHIEPVVPVVADLKASAVGHIRDAINCLGNYCLQNPQADCISEIKESIANLSVVLVDIEDCSTN